jgi:hypothetical protein
MITVNPPPTFDQAIALLKDRWAQFMNIVNSTPAWLVSSAGCLTIIQDALDVGAWEAAVGEGLLCFAKLASAFIEFNKDLVVQDLNTLFSIFENFFGGNGNMPCQTTHKVTSKVQGPGLCCAQVGVGLTPPPPGTTLPQYIAGQADAGQIPAGRIVQVTTAPTTTHPNGLCGSCMIVGSASKKHPGKPVLKFVPGGPTCPTAGTGCCAL